MAVTSGKLNDLSLESVNISMKQIIMLIASLVDLVIAVSPVIFLFLVLERDWAAILTLSRSSSNAWHCRQLSLRCQLSRLLVNESKINKRLIKMKKKKLKKGKIFTL